MPKQSKRTHPELRRVVRDHAWASLDEWVDALNELADLDEQEIDMIAEFARRDHEDESFS